MPSQWWTYEKEDTIRKRKAQQFEREAKAQSGPNPPTPPPPTPKGPVTGPGAASNFERYAKDALLGIGQAAGGVADTVGRWAAPKPSFQAAMTPTEPKQRGFVPPFEPGREPRLPALEMPLAPANQKAQVWQDIDPLSQEGLGRRLADRALQAYGPAIVAGQELRRGVENKPLQYSPEQRRELLSQTAMIAAFADAPRPVKGAPRVPKVPGGEPAPKGENEVAGEIASSAPDNPIAVRAKEKLGKPVWQMNETQFQSAAGIHQPWIAEISPVQYARMSKRQQVAYEAKRRGEWQSSADAKTAYSDEVMVAYDRGDFTLDSPDLNADAKQRVQWRLQARAKVNSEAQLRQGSETNRIQSIDDIEIGDRVYDIMSGRYTTVTKKFKTSVRVQDAPGSKEATVPARALQWLSYDDMKKAVQTEQPIAPARASTSVAPTATGPEAATAFKQQAEQQLAEMRQGPGQAVTAQKQPWEMTAEELSTAPRTMVMNEWLASIEAPRPSAVDDAYSRLEGARQALTQNRIPIQWTRIPEDYTMTKKAAKLVANYNVAEKAYNDAIKANRIESAQLYHQAVIAKALAENQPVPEAVLRDYPDLAAKYGKAQPSESAAIPSEVAPQPSQSAREVEPNTDLTPPATSTGELPAAGAGPSPASAMQAAPVLVTRRRLDRDGYTYTDFGLQVGDDVYMVAGTKADGSLQGNWEAVGDSQKFFGVDWEPVSPEMAAEATNPLTVAARNQKKDMSLLLDQSDAVIASGQRVKAKLAAPKATAPRPETQPTKTTPQRTAMPGAEVMQSAPQAAKEPWEMTKSEWENVYPQAPEGYQVLYHVTSPDNLAAIRQHGLKGELATGGDAPKGLVWATTGPRDYSVEQGLVAFRVPLDDSSVRYANQTERMVARDIPPDDILATYGPVSPLTEGAMPIREDIRRRSSVSHRRYVEQALATGEPVSQEVLADYPQLVARAPEGTAAPRDATPTEPAAPVNAEPAPLRAEAAEATRTLPPLTDNYLKPLSKYTDTVYREIGGEDAGTFIPTDATFNNTTQQSLYFATSPDLALGQGQNKGVLLEFDAAAIQGQVSQQKPAWQWLWDKGEAEFVARLNDQKTYRNALRAVTIRADAKMARPYKLRLQGTLRALEEKGWTKTANPDGSMTYRRPAASEVASPAAASAEPAAPSTPTKAAVTAESPTIPASVETGAVGPVRATEGIVETASSTTTAVDQPPVAAASAAEAPLPYQVSTDTRTGRLRLSFDEAPDAYWQDALLAAKWKEGKTPTEWGFTPRNANERQTALQKVEAIFGSPTATQSVTSTPRTRTPQPTQPPTPAQPGAPTPPPPGTTTGGPAGPGSTPPPPRPGAKPNPPPPGRLLPTLPSATQVDAQITRPGRIKGLAETLADVPGGKRTVGALDPGLVALEQYERVYLTFARWEDVAANVRRDAMLQLQSEWEKVRGLRIQDGKIVAGVQARKPGQSMAWIDVFEHIDAYAATPEIVRFVKLANRLIDEQFAYAKAAGAKLHQRDFGTGHYYGRAVEEVRNVEKRGAHRPDLSRVYDSMEAGIEAGIKYADDPMATFEIVFGALQRREIGARMRSLVAPLGKTTNELVDAGLTQRVETAKTVLDQWGKFAQTMRHVRDGMSAAYQPVGVSGPAQKVLRPELQAIADLYPDIGQRLNAALAETDALVRRNELAKLATEATKRAKEAGTEHAKARAARARAVANLQSPEFAAGALFGRPEPTIGIGRVQASWAGGRYFPRDVADHLNHAFASRRQDILGQLWGMVGATSSTLRTMKAGWDLGTMNIQLLPALAVSPKSWAKGMHGMVRYATNPKGYAEYLTAKLRNPKIMDLLERGLSIEGIEYSEALQRGGVLQRGARLTGAQMGGFLEGQVLRRAEMAFEAPLNITKLEMAEALYDAWKRGGQLDDLATFLNNLTGTRSSMATGIGSGQRSFEGTLLFFSPRYVRSSLALIADALQGGMKGDAARKALAGMAFVGLMAPLAIRAATGQEITEEYFDPRSPKFGSAEVLGRNMGFGTIYRSLVTLVGQSLKAAQKNPEVFLDPRDRRENPLVRWLAGRTSPVTSLVWNITEGRDFLGEPFGWGNFARQSVTPMWAQDKIDAGSAAEMIGLRAIPLSEAQKRNQLRDRYAQAEHGQEWDALSLARRHALEAKHPDLVAASKKALESGARRGYDESEFWLQVEREREPLRREIQNLGADLRAGKRSGNEYREEVGQREALMGRIARDLKAQEQWKDVPLTSEERRQKYGDDYKEADTPTDRFTQSYYALATLALDPQTNVMDVGKLSKLRDQLKRFYPPEVVAEAMADIKRNRDPEYVQAQEVMGQLMRLPRYAYTPTVAESDRVYKLVQQYNAVRGSLKNQYGGRTIPRNRVLAEIAQRYSTERATETYQALRLASRPNPDRWKIRQANWQLLERFYSDVLAAELPEENAPALPADIQQIAGGVR